MLKFAVLLAFFGALFGDTVGTVSDFHAFNQGQGNGNGNNTTITLTVTPSRPTPIRNSSSTLNSTTKLSMSTVHSHSSHTSHSMAPKSTSAARTSTVPVTSTAARNATTGPPSTTTPKPTTPPPYAKFQVTNGAGNFCILAHFEGIFEVKYESKNKTSNKTTQENVVVELNRTTAPKNSTDGSICSANHSKLVISWPKEKYYVLKMEFMREFGASESWKVSSVMLNVTLKGNKAFHNPTVDVFSGMTNKSDISGGKNENYLCKKSVSKVENKKDAVTVDITLTELKIEPFVNKKKAEFDSKSSECAADNPTSTPQPSSGDIVPIAVGCALAGLVLIVLIAYIIGRRKSHSGYEKV